jgi:hypothetical protein
MKDDVVASDAVDLASNGDMDRESDNDEVDVE